MRTKEIWLDYIRRDLIAGGELKRLIDKLMGALAKRVSKKEK
ncbi:MAG: hypothetical protein PF483_16090 [Halothiobacillus sp.]|jgi:hypothetical protein|nr:hypothetical protein [Halothiobacillus sp.]